VVADSHHDPAWSVAEEQISQLEARGEAAWLGARLIVLEQVPEQGSLKCAALHQAFGQLDRTTEVVALLDADAVVPPGWLEALVAGCAPNGIGAVSGNRLFVPAGETGAGLVRAIWNSGALVLMTLLEIPWAGSLAIRRQLIESSGWKQLLKTSFGDDTSLQGALASVGLRYQFRPELIIVDSDDQITFKSLSRWISRQMLSARLQHSSWPLVVVHGLATWSLQLLVVVCAVVYLLAGHLQAAFLLVISLLLYEAGCLILFLVISAVARHAIDSCHGSQLPHRPSPLLSLLRWFPVAQWIYGVAMIRALWARQVEWRGVHYLLKPRGVSLLSIDHPAAPTPDFDAQAGLRGPV
jgi:cellulose synthase/poly-beta-1,6-N-acetylglucosamine synthase-like glycosyltransferase